VKRVARWVVCARTYSCCRRLRHFFRESLELPVQRLPSLPFLLLQFNFIFIPITVFTFPVTRFVELNIRRLAEELDILFTLQYQIGRNKGAKGTYVGLPFSNHHWRLQMYVDDHEQLVITGLED